MLSPLLAGLADGERFGLDIVLDAPGVAPHIGMRGTAVGRSHDDVETRRRTLSTMLSTLVQGQLPGFAARSLEARDAISSAFAHDTRIAPRGRLIRPERQKATKSGPRAVDDAASAALLPVLAFSPERITAAVELLKAMGRAAALRLDLALVTFDAAAIRQLTIARDSVDRGEAHTPVEALRHLALSVPDDALLTAFLDDGGGVRLTLTVKTAEPLDAASRRMLCHAVFGAEPNDETGQFGLDLATVYPRGFAIPRFVGGLAAAAALSLRRPPVLYSPPAIHGFNLGSTADSQKVILTDADRALHTVAIGATGTGKSTLLLNQLACDMAAGHGCILLDPHGDLWEAARRLVPAHRRKDLILAHIGDPAHAVTMNIVAGLGGDPGIERSATVNGLIRLFKNILWPGVPEAFGPMFELYFRKALLLQMSAEHDNATILGVERIFQDEDYREDLIKRSDDPHVVDFWKKTFGRVTHHEIDIDNIAPYIICKLSPFTSSALLRPLLATPTSSLDLQAAIREGKIVLVNLAKGIIGEGACRLVGALLTMRLVASAQTQMRLPEADRRQFMVDSIADSVRRRVSTSSSDRRTAVPRRPMRGAAPGPSRTISRPNRSRSARPASSGDSISAPLTSPSRLGAPDSETNR